MPGDDVTRNDHNSIRSYPEYQPYFDAVSIALRKALKGQRIIGRSHLLDVLGQDPECLVKLGAYVLTSLDRRSRHRQFTIKERRIWTALGLVMKDHGFERYSDHAWIRKVKNEKQIPQSEGQNVRREEIRFAPGAEGLLCPAA